MEANTAIDPPFAGTGPGQLPALHVFEGVYSIVRLPAAASLPTWVLQEMQGGGSGDVSTFLSITKTAEELSIVALADRVNPPESGECYKAKVESDWRCIGVQGPLDFSLVGILHAIAAPLAAAAISIFAVSSYDTDYVLVRADRLAEAECVLSANGFRFQ